MIQNIWWPQKYYFFKIQQLIKKKEKKSNHVYQNDVFAFISKNDEGR